MNPQPLAAELRNHAARLRQINAQTEAEHGLLRTGADLLRVFAHVLDGKGLIQAFGLPGDWDRDTELGKAVIELRAGTCAGKRDRNTRLRNVPPPVLVQVTFIHCDERLPTDSRTVQIFMPGAVKPDERTTGVSDGWYEPENRQWFSIEGDPLPDGSVTWWAEQTPAPVVMDQQGEPKCVF